MTNVEKDPTFRFIPTTVPIGQLCEWFGLCHNTAIGTKLHPILGPVPICVSCYELMVEVQW